MNDAGTDTVSAKARLSRPAGTSQVAFLVSPMLRFHKSNAKMGLVLRSLGLLAFLVFASQAALVLAQVKAIETVADTSSESGPGEPASHDALPLERVEASTPIWRGAGTSLFALFGLVASICVIAFTANSLSEWLSERIQKSTTEGNEAADPQTVSIGPVRMLSFSVPDTHGGLSTTTGLLKIEQDCLALQFETKDSIFGLLKSSPGTIRLPYEEIDEINFRPNRWLGGKLTIYVDSLEALQQIPWSDANRLVVRTARRENDRAARFASNVNDHLQRAVLA